MLPGEHQDMLNSTSAVIGCFPPFSGSSLCQADLILLFQLVSLNTSTLLQEPASVHAARMDDPRRLRTATAHHGPVKRPRETFGISSALPTSGGYDVIDEDGEIDLENIPAEEREGQSRRFVPSFDILNCMGCFSTDHNPLMRLDDESSSNPCRASQMNIQGLLEAVRKGRVFLLNALQVA